MPKGRAVATPLSRATNKSTAEDIRIDVGVWCAHDLGSSSGARGGSRSSSGVEPSKRLVREHVGRRHSAEVEGIGPIKRRTVSYKGGHSAFCIWRESAYGLIHNSLSSSDAFPAGLGRTEVGRDNSSYRSAVYTLLLLWLWLLRPAIEREVEWCVGGSDLGGARESENEACRSIRRWESSEGNILSCTKERNRVWWSPGGLSYMNGVKVKKLNRMRRIGALASLG
jgi:hypothetical protein